MHVPLEDATTRRAVWAVRIVTGSVWIVFGLVVKLLDLVPRHERIVAAVIGEQFAPFATLAIGAVETVVGIWIISGWHPRVCIATQTAAIVVMNALELTLATDLLLAPIPMVVANVVFLAAGWWAALNSGSLRMKPQNGHHRELS